MNKIQQIIAMREGGGVKRHHTYKISGEDTVGNHTFNMLNLLLALNPEPSGNLIKAVLWHDIAERFVGDTPSPVKKAYPAIKAALKQAESDIDDKLGIKVQLSKEEDAWLHGVDKVEYYLWLHEQPQTPTIQAKISSSLQRIKDDDVMPPVVKDFALAFKPQSLDESICL